MVRTGVVIALSAQLALLLVIADRIGLSFAGWLVGAAVGVLSSLLLARAVVRSGGTSLGAANRVTFARAVLVGGVTALVADSFVRATSVAVIAALATVALILDGVDGRVARHTGTVSVIGARFDMEVDAFLIFALSALAAHSVGTWVLAIGAARYGFVVAGWLLPWLREPAPPRRWCKAVAAIQGIVLTVAVAGVLARPLIEGLLVVALGLLAESFGREAWWLWRHRVRSRSHIAAGELTTAGHG